MHPYPQYSLRVREARREQLALAISVAVAAVVLVLGLVTWR